MNIHLFSLPGENDISNIVNACRPYLSGRQDPAVAYLPAASIRYNWLDYTIQAFDGIAQVIHIDLEHMSLAELGAALDCAQVLYLPGGNTYLLNHRLHTSGASKILRERVRQGLPVAAFSAGTIVCGATIVTTNDLNVCSTPHFAGLGFTPFNFSVHFPSAEGPARTERILGLAHYHTFNANPVLALEDDASLRLDASGMALVQGHCWRFDPGREPRLLPSGRV